MRWPGNEVQLHLRMRAIAQSHKREEWPFIVNSGVSPLLCAKPALDFRAAAVLSVSHSLRMSSRRPHTAHDGSPQLSPEAQSHWKVTPYSPCFTCPSLTQSVTIFQSKSSASPEPSRIRCQQAMGQLLSTHCAVPS